MMDIVLFAILGACVHAPIGFWITYGILAGIKVLYAIGKTVEEKE